MVQYQCKSGVSSSASLTFRLLFCIVECTLAFEGVYVYTFTGSARALLAHLSWSMPQTLAHHQINHWRRISPVSTALGHQETKCCVDTVHMIWYPAVCKTGIWRWRLTYAGICSRICLFFEATCQISASLQSSSFFIGFLLINYPGTANQLRHHRVEVQPNHHMHHKKTTPGGHASGYIRTFWLEMRVSWRPALGRNQLSPAEYKYPARILFLACSFQSHRPARCLITSIMVVASPFVRGRWSLKKFNATVLNGINV